MAFNAELDALERAETKTDARLALSGITDNSGLSEAYFARLLESYAVNPAQTLQLARWWQQVLVKGDVPSLAYRAKGASDRLSGKWAQSAQAFIKAGAVAANPVDQFSYPAGAIEALARSGKVSAAEALGVQLSEGLLALGQRELAGRIELNLGNAMLWADRNEDARNWFNRAIAHLGDQRPLETASAHLGGATSNLYGGNPNQAKPLAILGRQIATDNGLDYLASLCDLTLAHVQIIQGVPEEALNLLVGIRDEFEGSPTDQAQVETSLGDAYYCLNLFSESIDAYRMALTHHAILPATDRADIHLGLGRALLAMGDQDGLQHLAKAVRQYRQVNNRVFESAALWSQAEQMLTKSPRRALALATRASLLAAKAVSPFYECLALLTCAQSSVELRLPINVILKRAKRLGKTYNLGYCVWKIHWLEAKVATNPGGHYRKMMKAIYAARLAQKSVIGRTSFLRDKELAVRDYINYLLARGSALDIKEALSVISQTRAVTLIDEILASGNTPLNASAIARLNELRTTIQTETVFLSDQTSARFGPYRTTVSSLQRGWAEANVGASLLDAWVPPYSGHPAVVCYEGARNFGFFATGDSLDPTLAKASYLNLAVTPDAISQQLAWLRYSLLEPLMNPSASPTDAVKDLVTLGHLVLSPWINKWSGMTDICPDGRLWRVPWDACAWALGINTTFATCMHPGFAGPMQNALSLQRVAIWLNSEASLSNAERESKVVLKAFPHAAVCQGRDAIIASLDHPWDLIHVIGHAHLNMENPMFSYLDAEGGAVYATEIASSRLRVGTVCLSACDTGALSLAVPLEPNGLIRSFLAKGANSAVASLWPLDDEAAFRFYECFYTIMKGSGITNALTEARACVRGWQPHPYYWGPFSLFKGYQHS